MKDVFQWDWEFDKCFVAGLDYECRENEHGHDNIGRIWHISTAASLLCWPPRISARCQITWHVEAFLTERVTFFVSNMMRRSTAGW